MVKDNVTKKRDLISMLDLSTGSDLANVLTLATTIKSKQNFDHFQNILNNESMAMIFEKSSTRTRVSFEVAMTQLGGHSLFLSPKDLQLARGETVADTAKVLSRYVDIIMYRAFKHEMMMELAKHSTVPVINALDDLEHPCQIVADLLTIKEHKGELRGLKLAYMGDGNNVCNSLLIGTALAGIDMRLGCPDGYEPDTNLFNKALDIAGENDCTITITKDPNEAVDGCDIIYTDVWVSMGDEDEGEVRNEIFKPYQVNSELVKGADSDYIFMHCLPAHRGLEVTSEVIDSRNSVIFDQAENRLHAQKAIILFLLNRN
jgi:ornithine carbamoyltransferase